MRIFVIAISMLLYAATPARAQVSVGIETHGVSIGFNMSSYPRLVAIPGYPVYYDPRADSNYFFYDGLYWVYQDDNWYSSAWYDGPWDLVGPEDVPLFVLRVPVRYYRHRPSYFSGWSLSLAPRWGEHWGHDWEQRRSGWDSWDRHSVPRAAPLPDYQRQYSGSRYPRAVEQQYSIQSKSYRYQPREAVTQQYFQQHAVPSGTRTQTSQQAQTQQHTRASDQAQAQQQKEQVRAQQQSRANEQAQAQQSHAKEQAQAQQTHAKEQAQAQQQSHAKEQAQVQQTHANEQAQAQQQLRANEQAHAQQQTHAKEQAQAQQQSHAKDQAQAQQQKEQAQAQQQSHARDQAQAQQQQKEQVQAQQQQQQQSRGKDQVQQRGQQQASAWKGPSNQQQQQQKKEKEDKKDSGGPDGQ